MANGLNVDESTFEALDGKKQNTILFKNTERILMLLECKNKQCDEQMQSCDQKFKKLEKRKLFDKGLSISAGAVGGFFAALGKGKLW